MAQENRATIKTYFETGDVPTQSQFGNSFDSQVFWVDDVETDLTSNSDSKVPTVKAVVDGIAAIPGQLTSDELDAIQGSSLPSSSNVFITEDAQTFTKDANDNVFYNGVSPTLGTSCSKNIFHKTGGAITLGNGAIGNIFEPTENTTNFVFGANLRNVTIKAGNYPSNPSAGTLTLTSGSYAFLYNKDYPAQIFVGANSAAYHSYYDGANNRYVITNLTTLAVSYIANPMTTGGDIIYGGASGVPTRLSNGSAGQVLQSNGTTVAPSWETLTSGGSTWTVVSANQVAVNDGQYTNVANSTYTDPTPVEGKGYWVLVRNGTATINSVAYSVAGTIVYRVFHSGAWATYIQSAFNDATSSIQTQIDIARRSSIFFAPSAINPVDSTTYYFSPALFLSTTQGDVDINLGYAFKVIGAVIQTVNNAGTAGSNEDSTLSLRNTTAGTSTTIGTFKTNAASNAQNEKTVTGLSISVASTDFIALQWAFPNAATNPTNVFLRITLIVEFT